MEAPGEGVMDTDPTPEELEHIRAEGRCPKCGHLRTLHTYEQYPGIFECELPGCNCVCDEEAYYAAPAYGIPGPMPMPGEIRDGLEIVLLVGHPNLPPIYQLIHPSEDVWQHIEPDGSFSHYRRRAGTPTFTWEAP